MPCAITQAVQTAPACIAAEAGQEAKDAAENNPVESLVAEIYATYLGGDETGEIDRDASFFDLGGNSLIAIQLINRLRETFRLDIPLRGFYDHSSIAAMSLQIAGKMLEDSENV